MVEIEEQFIKATSIYHALEDEILEVAEQGIEAKELEITRLRDNLAKLRSQMDDMPQNLIIIEKSALRPSQKLIHDGKEMEIDSAQKYFMTRLAEYPYINKIIWSENITAKHPTRISNIKEDGEITILYVTKDNYAAKIKIYPSKCPDRTHARYFAQRVSKSLGIVILEDKYGRAK